MPDEVENASQPSTSDADRNLNRLAAGDEEPPVISPPKTKAPVSFNQQNNFYQQIPTTAWDRLSAEQVVDLSRQVLKMADNQDERHFQVAKDSIRRMEGQSKRNVSIGSIVVVVGFGLTAFLSMHSHEMVALSISLPLATIVAMLVGNRVLK